MVRKKLIVAGLVSILGLIAAVSWTSYQWGLTTGTSSERERQEFAVQQWQAKTQEALQKYEQERSLRERVRRETVEVIRYVEDPSGCLDTPVLDDAANVVRQLQSGHGRPGSD